MGSMAAVTSDGAGDEVGLTLIHHFVGMIVGVVDTGVAVMPSADTVSPRRSPEKQEKQAGKENDEAGYSQYSLVVRIVEEFGWVAKKIGDVLFHDSYFTYYIARVLLRVSKSKAGVSPKLANLNANLQKLLSICFLH